MDAENPLQRIRSWWILGRTNPMNTRRMIPPTLSTSGRRRLTPEHVPGGALVLVGVFSDEPQSAAHVEHLVQEGGLTKLEQSLVGAAVQRHPLVVEKEQQ